MSPHIQRGQRIVIGVIWLQLMLAGAVILLSVAFGLFEKAGIRFLALLCELGLMRALWKGSGWARAVYTITFFIGAALLVLGSFAAPGKLPLVVFGPCAVLFAGLGYAIGFSRSVSAFLAAQRQAYSQASVDHAMASTTAAAAPELIPTGGNLSGHARLCRDCGEPVPVQIDWCPECGSEKVSESFA